MEKKFIARPVHDARRNRAMLSVYKDHLVFNSSAVKDLHYATHLQFLVTEDGSAFAFRPCSEETEMSFGFITEKRLESHNGKIYQQRITRTNIPEQITGLIDGDLDQYWYKFRGKLDADGTLIFSITPENIVKKTIEKRELENGII